MKLHTAVALCLAAGVAPAMADSRDLVLDRMARCYTLTDTRQYLECLYGAVQPLRNELGLAPAPQASSFAALFAHPAPPAATVPSAPSAAGAPALAARPNLIPQQPQQRPREPGMASEMLSTVMGIKTTPVPPEQFGLRNARPGPGVNVDHITARMAQYSLGGAFTVTLDNGQVWKQQKGDEHDPSWRKPAASYAVTISYGAGGSFNLVVTGERQTYKVTRIR